MYGLSDGRLRLSPHPSPGAQGRPPTFRSESSIYRALRERPYSGGSRRFPSQRDGGASPSARPKGPKGHAYIFSEKEAVDYLKLGFNESEEIPLSYPPK